MKIVDKYLYWKMCWETTFGHINIPVSVADKVIMVAILFGVYDINDLHLVVVFGLLAVVGVLAVGHLMIKYNIVSKELSLRNKYNPELSKIYEKHKD